jgi:choline dehydrogenase-like flavoprotein
MSSRLHYFGGTTMHWGGMCSPLDDIDFEKREWVDKSGWPINKNDLDEYYTKAQEILDLGPNEYNLPYWQRELK